MRMLIFAICMVYLIQAGYIQAQGLSEARLVKVHTEIEEVEEAFAAALQHGDCQTVASYFDRDFAFFVNGRQIDSHHAVLSSCQRIQRPFPESEFLSDEIHVISDNSAYTLRVIDLQPDKNEAGNTEIEVVTRIWLKKGDEWRIKHLHVSINDI
jgi:ketosteroid isomerase-like protein